MNVIGVCPNKYSNPAFKANVTCTFINPCIDKICPAALGQFKSAFAENAVKRGLVEKKNIFRVINTNTRDWKELRLTIVDKLTELGSAFEKNQSTAAAYEIETSPDTVTMPFSIRKLDLFCPKALKEFFQDVLGGTIKVEGVTCETPISKTIN